LSTEPSDTRRRTGQIGEDFAAEYLTRSLGWTILERNWRCARGELDIIAEVDEQLVIVEVRTRRQLELGEAVESVDRRKALRLRCLAREFLAQQDNLHWRAGIRFDVVGLAMKRQFVIHLVHIRDAIEGC
jgi:putative endonuclease